VKLWRVLVKLRSLSYLHFLLFPPRTQVVINGVQYRGRLDAASVLRAICAGFKPGTEPRACLTAALEPNECEQPGRGGCWSSGNLSACVDTFRGHACVCPPGTFGNGYECDDVDECAASPPPCEQRCANTLGGFQCACDPGFRLVGATACLPEQPGGGAPSPRRHGGGDSGGGGASAWAAFGAAVVTAAIAAALYKWRMRVHMNREVRRQAAACAAA
jgi:hypothetical protein